MTAPVSPPAHGPIPGDGAQRWLLAARVLLERVALQHDAIEDASRLCADAIAGDGLVHLFGTGHSRIPLEEMGVALPVDAGWSLR